MYVETFPVIKLLTAVKSKKNIVKCSLTIDFGSS